MPSWLCEESLLLFTKDWVNSRQRRSSGSTSGSFRKCPASKTRPPTPLHQRPLVCFHTHVHLSLFFHIYICIYIYICVCVCVCVCVCALVRLNGNSYRCICSYLRPLHESHPSPLTFVTNLNSSFKRGSSRALHQAVSPQHPPVQGSQERHGNCCLSPHYGPE